MSCQALHIRRDLAKHQLECEFRRVSCGIEGCQEQMSFKWLELHKLKCEHAIIQCTNGCGKELKRIMQISHQEECTNSLVECLFKKYGCTGQFVRKDMQTHLTNNQTTHLSMLITSYQVHIHF